MNRTELPEKQLNEWTIWTILLGELNDADWCMQMNHEIHHYLISFYGAMEQN